MKRLDSLLPLTVCLANLSGSLAVPVGAPGSGWSLFDVVSQRLGHGAPASGHNPQQPLSPSSSHHVERHSDSVSHEPWQPEPMPYHKLTSWVNSFAREPVSHLGTSVATPRLLEPLEHSVKNQRPLESSHTASIPVEGFKAGQGAHESLRRLPPPPESKPEGHDPSWRPEDDWSWARRASADGIGGFRDERYSRLLGDEHKEIFTRILNKDRTKVETPVLQSAMSEIIHRENKYASQFALRRSKLAPDAKVHKRLRRTFEKVYGDETISSLAKHYETRRDRQTHVETTRKRKRRAELGSSSSLPPPSSS